LKARFKAAKSSRTPKCPTAPDLSARHSWAAAAREVEVEAMMAKTLKNRPVLPKVGLKAA
jgi:hypothetical protein